MGVNMNSSWLRCAQYEFEFRLFAIYLHNVNLNLSQLQYAQNIGHPTVYLKFIQISKWQTNVFKSVVQFIDFRRKKCNILHSNCIKSNYLFG